MDGKPCRSNKEVMQRWSHHFAAAINHPPETTSSSLESEYISAVSDPNVRTEKTYCRRSHPRHQKVEEWPCRCFRWSSLELLKCALGPVSRDLYSPYIQVCRSGIVPAEWQEGIIINRTLCSNYRPITLLSVPGKVFAHVLLARIQPLFDLFSCRPQQSGFTAGRSTIDAVSALRLLSELHREFSRPLNVAFLNIKSAFDSVDRTALSEALRSKGMPDIILHLITALHENTGVGQKLSS